MLSLKNVAAGENDAIMWRTSCLQNKFPCAGKVVGEKRDPLCGLLISERIFGAPRIPGKKYARTHFIFNKCSPKYAVSSVSNIIFGDLNSRGLAGGGWEWKRRGGKGETGWLGGGGGERRGVRPPSGEGRCEWGRQGPHGAGPQPADLAMSLQEQHSF